MEKQLAAHGYYRKFTKDRLSDFKGSHEKETFFTPAEEGRILHELLQSVSYESVSLHSIYNYICWVCVTLQNQIRAGWY